MSVMWVVMLVVCIHVHSAKLRSFYGVTITFSSHFYCCQMRWPMWISELSMIKTSLLVLRSVSLTFSLTMTSGARSWRCSTSQMSCPLPPSLHLSSNRICLSLPPMTLQTGPYPSPRPLPHLHSPTAPAFHQTPHLSTTSMPCFWCSWSSVWCLVMYWYVWRCHGSVLCRPPPTTSLFLWPCPTCYWPRWSCHGAFT